MKFNDFKSHLDNITISGDFSFGHNWIDFVNKRMSYEIIESHKQDLARRYADYGENISGKRVIDIGCGSGLSSISFILSGARSLTSIDLDPESVAATEVTRKKFLINPDLPSGAEWNVLQQSIFDVPESWKGQFDIVYSWGVLHHTGNVWEALRKASSLCASGGICHFALYISGFKYSEHLKLKHYFSFLSRDAKEEFLYRYLFGNEGNIDRDVFSFDERGMNPFHDALDWLGGLPYEVVDPQVLSAYMKELGFTCLSLELPRADGGNLTAVYKNLL
jgi:2-polyprenyl-3-methyl-5-hydroxy-6-metoxy-1,4-benzoquinol methylase